MSAIAIISVAALCAGYVWVERRRVRRAAIARRTTRRTAGVLQWVDGGVTTPGTSSRVLQTSIERAVLAADVAWTYHHRLFDTGPRGESPFQIRRARVNGAHRRFVDAMRRVDVAAERWLQRTSESGSADDQSAMAVRRVMAWSQEHPLPATWPFGRADSLRLDARVDLLENALANLRQQRLGDEHADPSPFRRPVAKPAAEPAAEMVRQDVRTWSGSLSRRHASGSPRSASG